MIPDMTMFTGSHDLVTPVGPGPRGSPMIAALSTWVSDVARMPTKTPTSPLVYQPHNIHLL